MCAAAAGRPARGTPAGAVALLAAKAVGTRDEELLAWLDRAEDELAGSNLPRPHLRTARARAVTFGSLAEVAAKAGDRERAERYRAASSRLREGWLRRETAVVRALLASDE